MKSVGLNGVQANPLAARLPGSKDRILGPTHDGLL